MGVTGGQLGDGKRPIDSDRRILGMNPVLGFGHMGDGMQIEKIAVLGQGLESVGKTGRNQ